MSDVVYSSPRDSRRKYGLSLHRPADTKMTNLDKVDLGLIIFCFPVFSNNWVKHFVFFQQTISLTIL